MFSDFNTKRRCLHKFISSPLSFFSDWQLVSRLTSTLLFPGRINLATRRYLTKLTFPSLKLWSLHRWHVLQERQDVQGFCETESCCEYDFVISGLCPSYPANVKVFYLLSKILKTTSFPKSNVTATNECLTSIDIEKTFSDLITFLDPQLKSKL